MKKRIYLASPFFNEREIEAVAKAESILRDKGFEVWSPRENQFDELGSGTSEWSLRTYYNDRQAIDMSDLMVGLYWGSYSDSGTSFEFGYQVANNRPLVLVHLGSDSNLMCHEGAIANLMGLDALKEYDFEKMPSVQYTGKMF